MRLFSRKNKKQADDSVFYDEYKEIRDEAWRILAENRISELPVDLLHICDAENIDVYSYSQAEVLITSLHIEKQCTLGGCTVLVPDGRRIILYDDSVSIAMRRYLIACGIGYFVLGYAEKDRYNHNAVVCFSEEEQNHAGIFAARLLAPLSVLWGMNVKNAQEIAQVCLIPNATAEKRFHRLCEMTERNLERGMQTGQGTMLISGYERSAYRNFSRFAEEYRQNAKKID